jgi:hypothetical protein
MFNVAGRKLDRMPGLNMTAVSVERKHEGSAAYLTRRIDDSLMFEFDRMKKKLNPPGVGSWNAQMEIVRVFDQLICNTDRNLGNLVIDRQWRISLIDHRRAFRNSHNTRQPNKLTRCGRALLAKVKEPSEPQPGVAAGEYLTKVEIQTILARRSKIVGHYDGDGGAAHSVALPAGRPEAAQH